MKCFTSIVVTLIAGFLACTFAHEGLPTNNELLERVSSNIQGLNNTNASALPINNELLERVSSNIQGLNNINASALPSVEDTKNLFKQKCNKNGGPTAYDNAINAYEETSFCIQSLVNLTELQFEMEKAKPSGDLDTVFKKYCHKSPILKKCITNFTSAIEPCLEEDERDNKRIIQNITESLLSFICFKEGDRIALFIAEGGPECFQAKQSAVQQCANNTFGSYLPTTKLEPLSNLNTLPRLVLGINECNDMAKLQTCVVRELETCKDPTPANIVDSLFNFIKKVTPCENLLNAQSLAATSVNPKSSSSTLNTISILFTTIFTISLRFM